MMQVAVEDTHADYVICRGYDPRIRKFIDYDAADEDKPGVPVAKPYGKRQTGQYEVGQVFAALIPLTRIGQTAGVAATTSGHPADLDEEVEILYTDDDKVVSWLLLDDSGGGLYWGKLDGALAYDGTATVSVWEDDWTADTTENIEGVKPPPTMASGTITSGSWVRIRRRPDGIWYVDMAPC